MVAGKQTRQPPDLIDEEQQWVPRTEPFGEFRFAQGIRFAPLSCVGHRQNDPKIDRTGIAGNRFLKPTRFRTLFIWSCIITAMRWLIIGLFPESLPLLVFAQVLHAVSFGLFHGVAVSMIHRYFIGRHQHRGMALYGSISFGAGGAVGALASGYLMGWFGPAVTFATASVAVLLAAVLGWWQVKGQF